MLQEANLSKIKLTNQKKKLQEMTKNKQYNLIASVKNLNTGFINKHITGLNSEIGWKGNSVLVNYQSLVSILVSLTPLQLFFSIKCK